jgi:LCP family protein required for cell wall assembly
VSPLETLLHDLGTVPFDAPAPGRSLADRALARARVRTRRVRAASAAGAAIVVAMVAVGVNTVTAGLGAHGAPAARPATTTSADSPLATPRVNVLLLGSDAAADRIGVRVDSIVVASIDTRTGASTLIGLPRNLQHVPFPPGTPMATRFPGGFACPEQGCLLNDLWQYAEYAAHDPSDPAHAYYARDPNPGIRATVEGVEAVTGLTIDRYLVLDLRGFARLVDTVGGVNVDVKRPLPIGGHVDARGGETGVTGYLQPGRHHLDGYQALWFVRSRSDSNDYDRMLRQRCLVGALARQLDPATVLRHLPEIARELHQDLTTDVPLNGLDGWVTLLRRVQGAQVRSLVVTDAVTDPARPDLARIRSLVATAIAGTPPSGGATSAGAAHPVEAVC